jgi:Flp pilus assembly protein TadD
VSPSRQKALGALLVALVVALLYAPVRGHDWIRYDDDVYVIENPLVRAGFTAEGVRTVFTEEVAANYHPLTWLTHMLDVELFELEPAGPHLINVALHAANAVLVLYVLAALGLAPLAAALGAALFAWHPLRVESVAWAAERKDVLCAFFFLAALLVYLAHARAPSRARLTASLVLFLLALFAKPMAVTLPLVLVLLDRGVLHRHGRAVWLEKLPFFALAGLFAGLTLWAQASGGSTSDAGELAFDLRALNALATLFTYLRQSVFPSGLSVFYPHAAELPEGARAALLIPAALGALVLVAWCAGARRLGERGRRFGLGGALALAMLMPVLGFLQVGTQAHADRYTYLPSLGFVLALAGSLPAAGLRVLALALLPLCFATARQVAHWRDTRSLFTHALAVDPTNHVAHMKLGELARDAGELAEARAAFARAVEHAPRYVLAWNELGLADLALGDLPSARQELERAYALDPADAQSALNLGVVALEEGDLARADKLFLAAERGLADDPDLAFNRGCVAMARGDHEAGEAFFHAALALDERHVGAWNNLGELALAEKKPADAVTCFTRAVEAAPGDAVAHFNLGIALEAAGERERARASFARALALDGDLAPARAKLEVLGDGR